MYMIQNSDLKNIKAVIIDFKIISLLYFNEA